MEGYYKDVKLIAFHLPQFYCFEENDKWWGNGFTEWTNVRKALPLTKNHKQPRVPYEENYYDLSEEQALIWQMEMAKKYHVYGFCYYHYWFGGKLLLEKPIEIIRDSKAEKLPYCLCWANEPWTRSWDGRQNEVLMPQEYGGKEDWEAHFQYICTFFSDSAYIQVDGKPMMVLYRCNTIPDCNEMIRYWDRRCRENGFNGIYIAEELNTFQEFPVCPDADAYVEFEPAYTVNHCLSAYNRIRDSLYTKLFNWRHKTHCMRVFQYESVWKQLLRHNKKMCRESLKEKKRYPGAFVNWDNSPRKGDRGVIYYGATPEQFGYFMEQQKQYAAESGSEFIFINAWNEWGEGAYLEPDTEFGFGYLEQIQKIFS